MSTSRCPRVEELAWKMWRVADVPNDKDLQLSTLESLCQYLAGHLPLYFVKHEKRSISWLMKFPSIEAANSAEQHHYKNRKARNHESTHWRLRLVSQDYINVLTKTYGYGPLSPPGINHFLHLQEVYPEFRQPYFRRLYHESVSVPPIPPTTETAKSASPNLSIEPRQLDPALHESDSDPLTPVMMDLSEDFRLEFSPAQINGRSDTTDSGFDQLFAENGNHPQLNNFESDLADVGLGAFALPMELDPEPTALPAVFNVKGEEDLFNAFFNMDE